MKKLILLTILSAMCAAFAQSADKITEILGAQRLTFEQAAYLAQSSSGAETTPDAAFDALKQSGAIAEKYNAADPIPLKCFALICAKAWDVKGSLMQKAFKNAPRYAFRQLRADGVIAQSADPDAKPSGREALNIITNCIDVYGGEK